MRKAKKQLRAVCPKCFQVRKLQRHHYLPKRFFKKNNTTKILYLCDDCHKEIERILPLYRKLTKEEYVDIHKRWLKGEEVSVYPIKKKKFEKYWQKQYSQKEVRV